VIASIEAPFAFLQEPVKILLFDAVKLAHLPLGLVPEILDAVDVILFIGEQLRMIDAHVMKVGNIERVIRSESIRVDDAVRV
jgi:hypothetical protein